NSTTGPSSQYTYAPNAGDRRLTQIKNLGRSGDALSQFDYVYDPVGQITQITESLATTGGGGGGNTTGDTHTNGNGGQNGNGHQPGNNGYENGNGHTKPHTNNGKNGFLFFLLPGGFGPGTPGLLMLGCWGILLGYGLTRRGCRRQLVTRVTCLGLIGSLALSGCIFTGTTTSTVNVANFTYDKLGQLVGVDLNQTPTERYQFDPSGNLTSLTTGNITENFAANNLNQQTAPGTHVYDAKGQKTTLDGKTFEWDDQGRVTAIVQGTTRSEFAYDGMSRRTKITEYTNGTVTSKKLYWWLGGSVVCERDGLVSGFPITKRYFGQGLVQGTTKLFYTSDHLGSVRELVDAAGVVQAAYRYSTYGERAKLSGNLESDWGYAGLWHHGPSGLDLATYRLYDAANKRWISRDPLGEGVDYNLYRYCGNDPINLVDPEGLKPPGAQELSNVLSKYKTSAPYAAEGTGFDFGYTDEFPTGFQSQGSIRIGPHMGRRGRVTIFFHELLHALIWKKGRKKVLPQELLCRKAKNR
ncbi:MAG TPA: RHS repeat-associated core domain-containing protein, partial [Roseimicrobium sp.]|nr:RHS repeat-associated core domain-containing protein [Roseimicrobium sp.]